MYTGYILKMAASRGCGLNPHELDLERLTSDSDLREHELLCHQFLTPGWQADVQGLRVTAPDTNHWTSVAARWTPARAASRVSGTVPFWPPCREVWPCHRARIIASATAIGSPAAGTGIVVRNLCRAF